MHAKPWKSLSVPTFRERRLPHLSATGLATFAAADSGPKPPDSPGPERKGAKENIGVRRRRLKLEDPSQAAVGRLPRLSLRVKALRQQKEPTPSFPDVHPSLADLVCLAILEANLSQPSEPFNVSIQELPTVRVDSRWAPVVKVCLLYLVNRFESSPILLTARAALVGSQLSVEFSPSGSATLQPETESARAMLAHTLAALEDVPADPQLTLSERTIAIRLAIADGGEPDPM